MDPTDEVLDHLLRHLEVGDDAIAQRPARGDIAGGAAQHLLGLFADCHDLLPAADIGDRHNRWLGQDDTASLDVDQRIRGAKVDGHVG